MMKKLIVMFLVLAVVGSLVVVGSSVHRFGMERVLKGVQSKVIEQEISIEVPTVIPNNINCPYTPTNQKIDIKNELLKKRIITIFDGIDIFTTKEIIAQLLYLGQGKEKITIYISSPGGDIMSGLAVIDAIQNCSCEVEIIGIGQVASMGTIILISGDRAYAYPNTRILIHQPSLVTFGAAEDVLRDVGELTTLRTILNHMISKKTGHSVEKILKDTDRDFWMSAKEAYKYKLIDAIVGGNK